MENIYFAFADIENSFDRVLFFGGKCGNLE